MLRLIRHVALNRDFRANSSADVLDGVVVLRPDGIVFEKSSTEWPLYSRYERRPQRTKQISLVFIPYYAWANRQPSSMQVWTPLYQEFSPGHLG